jgi:hypothetical protein
MMIPVPILDVLSLLFLYRSWLPAQEANPVERLSLSSLAKNADHPHFIPRQSPCKDQAELGPSSLQTRYPVAYGWLATSTGRTRTEATTRCGPIIQLPRTRSHESHGHPQQATTRSSPIIPCRAHHPRSTSQPPRMCLRVKLRPEA